MKLPTAELRGIIIKIKSDYPIGNDIFSLEVMAYVLNFVCMFDYTEQTKNT
ncbi:hypothetical protein KAT92_05750 [Candidatus Babeliales bacterium]|nr:hypothetical protein [Candidatus Babeliales bacterium]